MLSVPVLLLGFAVRFLSPFPASLPQLLTQVLTFRSSFVSSAFSSGLFPSASASFRSLPLPFRLFSFLPFSVPFSSGFAWHWLSRAQFPLRTPDFPLRFASFPPLTSRFFGTWLSARFLSSFPASLPQPFHWCLPSAFALGLFPLASVSFRSLPLRF